MEEMLKLVGNFGFPIVVLLKMQKRRFFTGLANKGKVIWIIGHIYHIIHIWIKIINIFGNSTLHKSNN